MHTKILYLLPLMFLFGCSTHKYREISFLPDDLKTPKKEPKLNVFTPKDENAKNLPVLIFVHGGNWNRGDKDTYVLMGRNFAKKGVVAVFPDYTLSPNADYDQMARQVAAAITWTKANISKYKGDPDRIFISGHSAGGHLAALAVMNPKYGVEQGLIKGMILNDAAGLDMAQYLESNPPTEKFQYLSTWSADPKKWQDASPINFLSARTPPIYMYTGRKTFHMIEVGNERFLEQLQKFQPNAKRQFNNKNHFAMVIQYFFKGSNRYPETLEFIEKYAPAKSAHH
jgi:acetyl esterase/lipase